MSKTSLFVVGLLVVAAAVGGMWYRVAGDPGAMKRYDWVLEQVGLRKAAEEPPAHAERQATAKDAGGASRAMKRDPGDSDRVAARKDRRQQRDQLELFKLGLDLANILVGLIGIYLAVSGMRMRRNSES